MSARFHRRIAGVIGRLTVALLAVAVCPSRAGAQVQTAVWTGTSGNWDNPTIWTTSPTSGLFPNNGQPAGTTYNIQIAGSGQINLDNSFSINQLSFGPGAITAPNATNTLTINGAMSVPASASILGGTVNVGGMTSVNSTLTVGSGVTLGGTGTLQ
jgi:hypothetical protein